MPSDAIDFRAVRRVLVIMLRHHGDVLLTSPVFTSLKSALPSAEIDALVYADTAPMLRGHPAISRVHSIARQGGNKGVLAKYRSGKTLFDDLKSRHVDLIINLCAHWRGFWLTLLLRPAYAIAIDRPEFLWRRVFKRCYNDTQPGQHRVERNLESLRRLGIASNITDQRLVLTLDKEAEAIVAAASERYHLRRKDYIVIHPGSRWLFKCWPAASTARLIDKLHADGHAIVLTASPEAKELALIESIRSLSSAPIIDLAGQTSLATLSAWIASAKIFIGVDSVPMHIAAALQVPAVVLFGPSDESVWHPWKSPHRLITSEKHSCRPCDQDGCNGSKISQCLVDIDACTVYQAINDLLTKITTQSA